MGFRQLSMPRGLLTTGASTEKIRASLINASHVCACTLAASIKHQCYITRPDTIPALCVDFASVIAA
jgi:hypothetical protein